MDYEEFQEEIAPVVEMAKKNSRKIAIALAVLVILFVYFFVIPKAAAVSISVNELDGGPVNNAEVVVKDGDKVLASDLTVGGQVQFNNLPSQKDLAVSVDKSPQYEPAVTTLNLPSGGSQQLPIQLQRTNSMQFVSSDIPSQIPLGCSDKFNVQVSNGASEPYQAALAVEGNDITSVISAPPAQTVYANSTANISVSVIAAASPDVDPSTVIGEKKGDLRIKGTNVQLPIDVTLEPKLALATEPTEIDQTNTASSKQVLTISNPDNGPVVDGLQLSFTSDSDLLQACGNDLSNCLKIEAIGGPQRTELRPGDKLIVGVIINPPNKPGSKYLASLLITGNCFSQNPIVVPIRFDLQGGV